MLRGRLPLLIAIFAAVFNLAAATSVQRAPFAKLDDGTAIEAFTLTNAHGATAKILTYGAIIAELRVPDREGKFVSVVHEVTPTPENIQRGFPQAAAVMGRVANRIANAKFTLDGRDYAVTPNARPHHIHGGAKGFAKVNWTGEPDPSGAAAVTLTYVSRDGEEGYPATLTAHVRYALTDANTLRVDYSATTDAPTIVNLTNHAYFNLSGSGDVIDNELTIDATQFTEADRALIPTGKILPVRGTAWDFTTPTKLGARAGELGPRPHYDHNFVLDRRSNGPALQRAAKIIDAKSGRALEVWTTQPCVQLYTSDLGPAPNGAARNGFFCLETQHAPDAIHHPEFASTVLRPGETYRSATEFRFSAAR